MISDTCATSAVAELSKVTDFGTNRKPLYDFLLVNNTNLHPVLQHFPVFAH